MFLLQITCPDARYSHPTRRELRRKRAVLVHLPTGRKWVFNTKKAGIEAQRAYAAAVAEGRMSVLPPVPLDADCEPVAAAA